MLVRLRVRQRRKQPHVEVVADPCDRQLRDPIGDHQVGVERQVGTVLLDCAERLHENTAVGDQAGHVGGTEFGEVSGHERHSGTLRPQPSNCERLSE